MMTKTTRTLQSMEGGKVFFKTHLDLGKHNVNHALGYKDCSLTIDLELRFKNSKVLEGIKDTDILGDIDLLIKAKPIFSGCGDVKRRNTWIMGGQCIDHMNDLLLEEGINELQELCSLWEKYHLNDMNSGTIEQSKCLEKGRGTEEYKALAVNDRKWSSYTNDCEYLKAKGLYEVPHPDREGEMYKYGFEWLYRPIPKEDLERIVKYFISD